MLRHIAAGLNLPYELLLKDFSKTNYSSARAALLEAWRYFHGRRRWLMDYWLRPIYELWLEEAINSGLVEAPDFYAKRTPIRVAASSSAAAREDAMGNVDVHLLLLAFD